MLKNRFFNSLLCIRLSGRYAIEKRKCAHRGLRFKDKVPATAGGFRVAADREGNTHAARLLAPRPSRRWTHNKACSFSSLPRDGRSERPASISSYELGGKKRLILFLLQLHCRVDLIWSTRVVFFPYINFSPQAPYFSIHPLASGSINTGAALPSLIAIFPLPSGGANTVSARALCGDADSLSTTIDPSPRAGRNHDAAPLLY